MKTKQCTKCKQIKPLSEFNKDNRAKDSRASWCKKCLKEWQQNNKKHLNKYIKNYKEQNKKHLNKYIKNRKEKYPWYNSYNAARQRCTNPNTDSYKYYGGRGIEFNMTIDDFKYLWFRDNAFNMDKPSIDRIDSDGNYELDNCRYIELIENCSWTKKNKTEEQK